MLCLVWKRLEVCKTRVYQLRSHQTVGLLEWYSLRKANWNFVDVLFRLNPVEFYPTNQVPNSELVSNVCPSVYIFSSVLFCSVVLIYVCYLIFTNLVSFLDNNGGEDVESSWIFRLILNLIGYCTVVVPGIILYLYVKKSKILEKPGSVFTEFLFLQLWKWKYVYPLGFQIRFMFLLANKMAFRSQYPDFLPSRNVPRTW